MAKDIYLILSQTSSWLSSVIKVVTGNEFNHISISLSPSLDPMYSFGRRQPYNPIWGGFVKEYIGKGTFYRFPKTRCVVLRLSVSNEQYEKMDAFLAEMYSQKERYGYNSVGLVFAAVNIPLPRGDKYYCSEFVKAVFTEFGVEGANGLPKVTQPCDFLAFPGVECVYRGLLREFPVSERSENCLQNV